MSFVGVSRLHMQIQYLLLISYSMKRMRKWTLLYFTYSGEFVFIFVKLNTSIKTW